MNQPSHVVRNVEAFLELLVANAGFNLEARVEERSSGPFHADPTVFVELSGRDAGLLTENRGELLHAIEHVAAQILRLEPEEHDRIFFDAEEFKAKRNRALHQAAQEAIAKVLATSQPFAFPPMSSRERRLLHLAISPSGLRSASMGEGPRRAVVIYPAGATDKALTD